MDNKTGKRALSQWLVAEKNQQLIRIESRMQSESFQAMLGLLLGNIAENPEISSRLLDKLQMDFESMMEEELKASFESQLTLEELQELKDLTECPTLVTVQESKYEYQQYLIDAKEEPEARRKHMARMEQELQPKRREIIEALDNLLGESQFTIKQSLLNSNLMLNQGVNQKMEISQETADQLKDFTRKTMVSYFHKISDENLSDYVKLLKDHPVLLKEYKIIQESVADVSKEFFKKAGQIKLEIEEGR